MRPPKSANALPFLTTLTSVIVHGSPFLSNCDPFSVADPGFPVGGRGPRRGGMDSRGSYVSQILYVKMKESGPLGGVHRACPP